MYWDRFDIVEAHYMFYCDWHSGQASPEYARLSQIGAYFTPRPNLSVDTLSDNAREIYDALVQSRVV